MGNVIKCFESVRNVEFEGFTYYKELNTELPTLVMKEEKAEEWNKKARIQNTKMFVEFRGRQPKDYQEVLTWVYGMIPEEKPENPPVVYMLLETIKNAVIKKDRTAATVRTFEDSI